MQVPRYMCAAEVAFLPKPQPISLVAQGGRVGINARCEQGDEFDFDGVPGAWMEPINDAAFERVQELVEAKKRKTVGAPKSAPTTTLQVPKSGMAGSLAGLNMIPAETVRDIVHDERPAPRRRPTSTAL